MRVLQINTFYIHGSTGRIMYDLMSVMEENGITAYAAYGQDRDANKGKVLPNNVIRLQGQKQRKLNILRTRLFDHHGFYNEAETRKLLKWIDEVKPDIIHLHNIHNHYVHVGKLFAYIKQHEIPVVWTLHDCWPFTGHCAYFDYVNCDKWKTKCFDCPSLKEYPPTWIFDRTSSQFEEKKDVFCGVKNLTIVTPSQWLANLCKESFLKDYPVIVVNNGIDTSVFKPQNENIKEKLGIKGKKMILAVSDFQKRKGVEYLLSLPKYLSDDEVLVWVGLEKKHLNLLPAKKCVGITKTSNVQELASYYSACDVFVNPTLEDNFPTTNIEAISCGAPIVTFRTGGSIEPLDDGVNVDVKDNILTTQYGAIVEKGDAKAFLVAIRLVLSNDRDLYKARCSRKGSLCYNKWKQYRKYIDIYKQIK